MKEILLFLKKLKKIVFNKNNYILNEIRYFSPTGLRQIPNGHPIQKGGFIKECIDNKNKFITQNHQFFITKDSKILESKKHENFKLNGGIIVLYVDLNFSKINISELNHWFVKIIQTELIRFFIRSKPKFDFINFFNKNAENPFVSDFVGSFSIGNFFYGKYIDEDQNIYNEESIAIEINGITTKGLIYIAKKISESFNQQVILINDLNINKIFSLKHL